MPHPLNVLFVTLDQWRADCLSALGHPVVETPVIDALAADGVLFRNHFAQCSPCGPSRTSMLTGMYLMNHRSGRNGTPLDARFTNLALEARAAGYDPALIGYTDTSVDPRLYAPDDPILRRGYEGVLPGFTPLLLMPTDPTEWVAALAERGYEVPARPYDVYCPPGGHRALGGFGPFDAPARYRAEDSDTAFSTDRALDFIAEAGDEPWFLHLVYLRPHPPYIAPEPYNRLYSPNAVPPPRRSATPEETAARHPYLAFALSTKYGAAGTPEADLRRLRATYYGLIAEVDHNLGRLIAHLKRTGQYERTLIVVTSDHGEMLGDHWLVGKEWHFDAAFRVPLVIRAPGARFDAARGRRVDDFTESVDLMPTTLDLIGRAPPRQCDGHSLVPWLEGATPGRWRDAAHWELDFHEVDDEGRETRLGIGFDECSFAVHRGRRFKYVHFAALPPLLFDLERDPDEHENRAAEPEYAGIALDCAQRLLSWGQTYRDRALTDYKLTPEGVVKRERTGP